MFYDNLAMYIRSTINVTKYPTTKIENLASASICM